jgi:protein-S-isoprenylcysteine O-methyltransferase Ste14
MTLTADRATNVKALVLDLVERGFLLALSLSTVARLAPSLSTQPFLILLLISEGLAVAFILLRRRAFRSDCTVFATVVAFVGTAAPLFVIAPGGPIIPPGVGAVLMIAGLLLNIASKVALNRSFGLAPANRGVKRAGPYRYLRHPMYAGYMTTQIAALLLNPCLWNLGVYAVAWSAQIFRIQAEEKLLRDDPEYRTYSDAVRYRLIPWVY